MTNEREYLLYEMARLRMQAMLKELQVVHEAREAVKPHQEQRRFHRMYRLRRFVYRMAPKMARAWFL
jgi:hypothetical protein